MGCACFRSKTSYEEIVDDIFLNIPIRNHLYEEILKTLQDLEEFKKDNGAPVITEISFQIFYNKFLKSEIFIDSKNNQLNYWLQVFRNKPTKIQYSLLKLNLYFLCNSKGNINKLPKKEVLEAYSIILEYINIKLKNKKKDDKHIIGEELFNIIKDYVTSISLLTVDFFKHFDINPIKFKDNLSELWAGNVINDFVKKTFFKKEEGFRSQIKIKKFLKNNLILLKNDCMIRKLLSEFSVSSNSNDNNLKISNNKNLID